LYKTDFLNNMLTGLINNKKEIKNILEKEIRNLNNTIENLLDTLLKKLNVGASAINTLSAGVGMVDSMLECQTAFDTLLTEIDEYGTSKSAYDTGYTDFKNAVVA